MYDTPIGYEKPERRDQFAESHWCKAVGSRVYAPIDRCGYCDDLEESDGLQEESDDLQESTGTAENADRD